MSLLDRLTSVVDPDRLLQLSMDGVIEAVGARYAMGRSPSTYAPGEPLKLLLAGYVGTRNTGADVRVEEMIRQIRHCVGDEELELTAMTVNEELTAGYFRAVRQVEMPTVFPKFLFDECPKHHGVIACEGSMFKSKFASALTTMMSGAIGIAAAERKLSVGYGAEAGDMTPSLRSFVERHCKQSFVLCRNDPSRGVLDELGIRNVGGTDTAWTFTPAPQQRGAALLREAGWDGESRVLVVCPIHPYWWPVKPDLLKAFAKRFAGQYRREHYKSIYFHEQSEEIDQKFDAYLDGIAGAVNAFCREQHVFPILVGMEQLDRLACQELADRLDQRAPLFISDSHTMYDLVSVLRNCSMMVSSRFHAIVTSMPGLVPSAGITMDERIRNLMRDRGHDDLFIEVDDPEIEAKTLQMLRRLHTERDAIAEDIAKMLPQQLRLMGQMGIDFLDELQRVYPDFPRIERPCSWDAHLPSLPDNLKQILEQHG